MRGFGAGGGSAALALAFAIAAVELAARLATAAADMSSGVFGMISPETGGTLDPGPARFNPAGFFGDYR